MMAWTAHMSKLRRKLKLRHKGHVGNLMHRMQQREGMERISAPPLEAVFERTGESAAKRRDERVISKSPKDE